MADNTLIEWARHPVTGRGATWNPITGCTLESDGCRNCYAARLAATRLKHTPSRQGLAKLNAAGVAKFTGEVRFNEGWLDQPLRWKAARGIFVCAHGDLFAPGVPDEWIDKVFAVMALSPQHVFFVLTKRPARAREYLGRPQQPFRIASEALSVGRDLPDGHPGWDRARWTPSPIRDCTQPADWPLPNVWLGTSVEDQPTADARIPELLAAPAALRFVSAEPLLGMVDLLDIPWLPDRPKFPQTDDLSDGRSALHMVEGIRLDWVIAGGESGSHARPMHPDWPRSLRDQCAAAGVPFLFKQWGEWAPCSGEDVPARFDDPSCDDFRCMSNCGYVGKLAISYAFLHKPRTHPACFPNGADGDAVCNPEFIRRVGKKAAGRLLDGVTHDAMPGTAYLESNNG